jgi:predicted metalloprotease with PDZ domain
MQPYDYTRENYFRTGYVAEGVTTYYGDMMLYRSKVLNMHQYFTTVKDNLQKHFHNYGRLNMPVSEASFDAWVDGYEPGIPHRKTSIYTEGALCAMMEDILIVHHSQRRYSLDDVMKELYTEFAKKGKGYTADDYRSLLEKYSGVDFKDFFARYVHGCENYEFILAAAFRLVGLEVRVTPSNELFERNYGFKVSEETNKVTHIAPGAPAYLSGLMIGDVIASVNGFVVNGTVKPWFNYFKDDPIHLRVRTYDGRIRHIEMPLSAGHYFPDYSVMFVPEPTEEQARNYERWTKNTFPVIKASV